MLSDQNPAPTGRRMGSTPPPGSAGGAGKFSATAPPFSLTGAQGIGMHCLFESTLGIHGGYPAQARSDQEDYLISAPAPSLAGGARNFSDTEPFLGIHARFPAQARSD